MRMQRVRAGKTLWLTQYLRWRSAHCRAAEDAELVRRLVGLLRLGERLKVDANGGWTVRDAVEVMAIAVGDGLRRGLMMFFAARISNGSDKNR